MDKIYIQYDLTKLKTDVTTWKNGIKHHKIIFVTSEIDLLDYIIDRRAWFVCYKGKIRLTLSNDDGRLHWNVSNEFYGIAEIEYVETVE